MRAVVHTRTGEPSEVLSVAETDEPHAGPGEVRIEVRAAGVNPIDWKLVTGLMGGAPDRPRVPGIDAAGLVDEIGEGVTGVHLGDPVFGQATGGSAAEYAVLSAWAAKPEAVPFEAAGALPVAGETAVRVLDLLGLRAGQTVVVDGASGGVGSTTVQVAVARGLRVIGTAGGGEPGVRRLPRGRAHAARAGAGRPGARARSRRGGRRRRHSGPRIGARPDRADRRPGQGRHHRRFRRR